MNLWVNRVRQLTVGAVALLFYSCTDDINLLGYKNPNSKFDVKYIELPVESSVLLDSVRGSHFYNYSSEPQRFLVGKYSDPKFGNISSSTCTQFFATNGTKLSNTADYDSVTLELRFDWYTYGASKTASGQTISVYELDQELDDSLKGSYFTTTPIVTKPASIGSKLFSVNPTEFQSYLDSGKDTVRTIRMTLDYNFGERIFNSAIQYRDATSKADSAFYFYSEFVKQFYGIAIVPSAGDKVFSFVPGSTASKITLHYHTTTDTLQLPLYFAGTAGYNSIVSERGGTELAGLTQYHQDFSPLDDKRYIQSGIGISTKLDFNSFIEFSKDIPNMIINSAELVVGEVEDGGAFDPPRSLVMRVLKDDNRKYAYGTKNDQSIDDYSFYNFFIMPDYANSPLGVAIDNDSTFTLVGDNGTYSQLNYSKSEKKYTGFLTRFLQQLYTKNENRTTLRYFSLTPLYQPAIKSVNRVVFPKDNIKLRVYYTLPTVNN